MSVMLSWVRGCHGCYAFIGDAFMGVIFSKV